ncbi:MAG TPA: PLP-dependent aminotransferase family protein [Symbiobacteriaceae bacterium]|nr:PLP-dependent aminotransferase family protein [Symbiobacteriaceae bacterium]
MTFFPPHVERALQYPPPGAWFPPVRPGTIRLNAGYPFPASVPAAELAAAAQSVVAREADRPFHYLSSPAMRRLPGLLARRSAERGIPAGPGELMVTAGAIQAVDLAARALLGPEDVVAVEAPTYMEALEMFRNYTPHIQGYPVDARGLVVEALAADLADRRARGERLPRLLYTIASFQNPTGTCLPPDRRQRLLDLAEEYDFFILEDDAYGELAYGEVPVPLKAMDRTGRVIYAGSLSKIVAPGMRVGWAIARPEVAAAMWNYKKDLEHAFAQAVMSEYLESIDLGARVAWLREQYRGRRDLMVQLLRRYMPEGVTWQEPEGGYFVWLHAPGLDTAALLPRAVDAGVAYIPGVHFHLGGERGKECLRLSFSFLPPEQLEEGARILGQLMR